MTSPDCDFCVARRTAPLPSQNVTGFLGVAAGSLLQNLNVCYCIPRKEIVAQSCQF